MRRGLLVFAAALAVALGACEPKPGSPPKPKTTVAALA
jgi:hypothetical protein